MEANEMISFTAWAPQKKKKPKALCWKEALSAFSSYLITQLIEKKCFPLPKYSLLK